MSRDLEEALLDLRHRPRSAYARSAGLLTAVLLGAAIAAVGLLAVVNSS